MALPYINLYIGDIKKDTDLLSPAAFGAYTRLLFKMHEAAERGKVAYTLPQLCRVFGAETLEQTSVLMQEINDPAYNIFDYSTQDGKHCFINRRMVRETKLSEARSEAGKKGAAATNNKNRQPKDGAEDFAAAKPAANNSGSEAASSSTNHSSNQGQNYNTNTNINNSIEDNKGGPGEKEETRPGSFQEGGFVDAEFSSSANPGFAVLIVPEMLSVFKSFKPKYVVQQEKDFPALRKIAETIANQEGVFIHEKDGVDKIKNIWSAMVEFLLTDKLYKDFQISQVEKYFQSIASKFSDSLNGTQGKEKVGKNSIIANNAGAANHARDLMKAKYKGGEHA